MCGRTRQCRAGAGSRVAGRCLFAAGRCAKRPTAPLSSDFWVSQLALSRAALVPRGESVDRAAADVPTLAVVRKRGAEQKLESGRSSLANTMRGAPPSIASLSPQPPLPQRARARTAAKDSNREDAEMPNVDDILGSQGVAEARSRTATQPGARSSSAADAGGNGSGSSAARASGASDALGGSGASNAGGSGSGAAGTAGTAAAQTWRSHRILDVDAPTHFYAACDSDEERELRPRLC